MTKSVMKMEYKNIDQRYAVNDFLTRKDIVIL